MDITPAAHQAPPFDLDAIADRQQQIVTRGQLLAAGFDDMYLYRQTRRGQWARPLPATYSLVTGALTDEQRRIAAALYTGADAQLTGLAALTWYGFRYSPRSERIQLIVPHRARRASTGFVVVSRAIVAESVQRGYTDLTRLDEEIIRARRSRTALARQAFREVLAGTRSAPEAEFRECLAVSRILPGIAGTRPCGFPTDVACPPRTAIWRRRPSRWRSTRRSTTSPRRTGPGPWTGTTS